MFRIIPDGLAYREYVLLKDGESLLFRAATPGDLPAVDAFMRNASRESLQMRFMGGVSQVSRRFIEDLCANDPKDRYCILALHGDGPGPKVIGLGNYVGLGGRNLAEVAFLVADEHQGKGIGTLLLDRLAGVAAGCGYLGFEAEVLYDNPKMIRVFRGSGFETRQAFDGGCIHLEFPVSGAAAVRERGELRDRIAAANSMLPLLKPSRVAVAGASRDPSSVGGLIFRNLLQAGFQGTLYPVNPQADSIHGVPAYPSLLQLPGPVDLVVIAVPASSVLEVAEHAIQAGARALLVVSSGFAETGPEGAALQAKLVELVRTHGARLVGPNCLGVVNTHPEVRLNASLAPRMPRRGRLAFFAHSGALGLVILDYASERGLGFSSFVTAGNRADVSGNDLLRYWEEDPDTDMVLLYLETFGNPRRFARVARRVARRKPILCVKAARSRAGREAARAHIAAEPQSEVDTSLLFQQAGVLRLDTLEEMFDTAVLLAHQPLPGGNRVAIVSNSGGVITLCADACEASGLEVRQAETVDLGALATAGAYEKAVSAALREPAVDALIVLYAGVGDCDPAPVRQAILRGVEASEAATGGSKPVLLCMMGVHGAGHLDPGTAGNGRTFPFFRFPESAARALGQAAQCAAFRRQPPGRLLWFEDAKGLEARQRIERLLEGRAEDAPPAWMDDPQARALLSDFGIPLLPSEEGRGTEEALRLVLRTDPHFGPVLGLRRNGRPPSERITPLLDTDAREMVEAVLGLLDPGLEELLGRVSQLVEELPWITEIHALAQPTDDSTGRPAAILSHGLRIRWQKA